MKQSIKNNLFSLAIGFAIIGIMVVIASGRPFSSTLGAPVVLISEEDGDPISRLRLLQVPNDSLTDAGGGILSLDTSSGDANAVDVAASTNSLAVAISTTGVVVLKNAVDISTVNAAKVDRDGDTLTGQLILVDGTAATPSIRGTADNSGLSFSSVKMVWSRLGADKIRFDGAGISMPSGLAINLGGIDTASDNISKIGADIRIRAGGTDVAFFGSALIRLNKPVDVLGTITATGLDCTDCVNTSDIADSAVTSGKIGDGAVTSDKVSAGAIQTAKLANGAVTEIKIADGAVTTAKFADVCAADQVIARNAGDTAWECATVGGVALGDSPTWTGSHTWDNPLLAPSGSPGAPSYSFTSDTNSGMQNSAADELAFVTAGGQRVIIRSAEILVFQPLRTELGSAGIPSHSFRQDTNTGMFRTTEGDTLGFSTNSSERMRIDASGNVGIGTASPLSKLEVDGNFAVSGASVYQGSMTVNANVLIQGADLSLRVASSNNVEVAISRSATNRQALVTFQDGTTDRWHCGLMDSDGDGAGTEYFCGQDESGINAAFVITIANQIGIGVSAVAPSATLHVNSSPISDDPFLVGVSSFIVKANGNVGIGTASPAQALDVVGSIIVSNDFITADDLLLSGAGASAIKWTSGRANIETTAEFTIDIDSDNNQENSFFRITKDGNASELMRIQEDGNMGIGDSAPTTAKLTVQVSEASQEGIRISSQNATVMFVVDRKGNVGIGVVTPIGNLHISGGTSTTAKVTLGETGAAACMMFRDTDLAGWTECFFLNGVQSCTIDADGVCDGI